MLKKIKLLFMGLVLFSCSANNIELEEVKLSETKEDKEYSIVLPKYTDKSAKRNKGLSEFNKKIDEYVKNTLDLYNTDGKEIFIDYDKKENSLGIDSFVIFNYTYLNDGGAHGMNVVYTMNTKGGKLLENLIDSDGMIYFENEINNIIKSEKIMEYSGEEINDIDKDSNVYLENGYNVYFEGDELVFIFQRYELAPYGAGYPVIKFKVEDVKQYLNL